MRATVGLALVALVGALAFTATRGPAAAMVAALILVAANLGLFWLVAVASDAEALDRVVPLLAACWLAMALVLMHNFQHRSTTDVVQSASSQTAIELAVFGIVGAVAFFVVRTVVPLVPITPTLAVLPVVLAASATWGESGLYSLARGIEVMVMALLAMSTAGLAAVDHRRLDEMMWTFFRWTAFAVAALVCAGFLLGPLYVSRSPANADRFTWLGAHPAASGFLLSVAFLIVASAPKESLGIARSTRIAMVLTFAVALYLNQSRTATLTVGLGLLFVARHVARRRPDTAVLVTLMLSIAAALSAGFVGRYFLRGGDADTILTLNGRTDLWQVAFDELNTFGKWALGLGYGTSRLIFVDDFRFATSAHNSLLSALVDGGLLAAFLVVIGTTVVIWYAVRAANSSQCSYSLTLATVMLATVVSASTSDSLVRPGTAAVLLYLASAAVAAGRLGTPSTSDSGHTGIADRRAV